MSATVVEIPEQERLQDALTVERLLQRYDRRLEVTASGNGGTTTDEEMNEIEHSLNDFARKYDTNQVKHGLLDVIRAN